MSPIPASGEPDVASDRVAVIGATATSMDTRALFVWRARVRAGVSVVFHDADPASQGSGVSGVDQRPVGGVRVRDRRAGQQDVPLRGAARAPPAVKRVAWRGLPVVAVLGTAAMFVWFFVWEHRLRMLMDAAQLSVFDSVVIVVLTVILLGLIIGVSRMWVRARHLARTRHRRAIPDSAALASRRRRCARASPAGSSCCRPGRRTGRTSRHRRRPRPARPRRHGRGARAGLSRCRPRPGEAP